MSEESSMAKYIIYGLDGDPGFPCLNSCLNSTDMGPYVLNVVGAGNPFYAFESLPAEVLTADEFGADFNGAPLASTDWQTNRNLVAAQFANPVKAGAENNGENKVWKVS
jgi:hypothetical protein